MRLEWFRIQNYRSVLDSDVINMEDLLVLVGPNQSGKSSILTGLRYLSFDYTNDQKSNLTQLNNIKKRYIDGDIEPRKLPIVTAYFTLEDSDIENIVKTIKPSKYATEQEDDFGKNFMKIIDDSSDSITSNQPDGSSLTKITLNDKKLNDKLKENLSSIEITKYVDGSYSVKTNVGTFEFNNVTSLTSEIKEAIEDMVADVPNDFVRPPNVPFKPNFDTVVTKLVKDDQKTILSSTWLQGLQEIINQGIDQPLKTKLTSHKQILTSIASRYTLSIWKKMIVDFLKKNMPNMVYFSSYNRLEDSITIQELQINTEQHQTFVNLLHLAEIKPESLQELKMKTGEIHPYLENASSIATKKITKAYQQEDLVISINYSNDVLSVFTKDPNGSGILLPPSSGSEGFQWYLGFFINFVVYTKSEYKNAILLLDDPGVLLHPTGHKDLLARFYGFLEDQVRTIYATHLPSLIPKHEISSIRVVDKKNSQTAVTENFWKLDNKDAWAPVRSALGINLEDSFIVGEKTVLVEGPSDIVYLEGFKKIIDKNIESSYFCLPINGITNIPYYVNLIESLKVSYVALLDEDGKSYGVDVDKLLRINPKNLFRKGQKDFDIEDLLESEILAKSIVSIYPDLDYDELIKELQSNDKKAVTIIKRFLKNKNKNEDFDKIKVAKEALRYVRNNLQVYKRTIDNFKHQFEQIDSKFVPVPIIEKN